MFVLGALALAGGAAVYLRVSPLAVGLVAGVFWRSRPAAPIGSCRTISSKVQHPLVVLLLVTAGALWVPSRVALWLLAPYLLFRLAGKVAGAWVSARIPRRARRRSRGVPDAAWRACRGVCAQLPADAAGRRRRDAGVDRGVGTAAFELFALAVVPHWRRRAPSATGRRAGDHAVLAWLLVPARHRAGRRTALALGVALHRRVDRRLALRVPAAAAHHRLSRLRPALRPARRATSSPSRWRAICARPAASRSRVIAFIAGLQLQRAPRSSPSLAAHGDDQRRHDGGVRGSGWRRRCSSPGPGCRSRPSWPDVQRAGGGRRSTARVLVGVSPTVTVAVIAESRARGPLSTMATTSRRPDRALVILRLRGLPAMARRASASRRSPQAPALAPSTAWTLLGSLAFGAIARLAVRAVRPVRRPRDHAWCCSRSAHRRRPRRAACTSSRCSRASPPVSSCSNVLGRGRRRPARRDPARRDARARALLHRGRRVDARRGAGDGRRRPRWRVGAACAAPADRHAVRRARRPGSTRLNRAWLARAAVDVGHHPRPRRWSSPRASRLGRPAADAHGRRRRDARARRADCVPRGARRAARDRRLGRRAGGGLESRAVGARVRGRRIDRRAATPGGVSVALDALMRERGGVWVAHGAGSADRVVVDERSSIDVPPDAPAYRLRRLWLTPQEEERLLRRLLATARCGRSVTRRTCGRSSGPRTGRRIRRSTACSPTSSRSKRRRTRRCSSTTTTWRWSRSTLRERRPLLRTALFWHIPWPDVDRLRICPWRKEMLEGLLSNDLLAFQLPRDQRNFLRGRAAELGASVSGEVVYFGDRPVRVLVDSDRRRLRSHHRPSSPTQELSATMRAAGARAADSRARSSASASIGSTTRRAFPSGCAAIERVLARAARARRPLRVRADRRAVARGRARLCRDLRRDRRAGRADQRDATATAPDDGPMQLPEAVVSSCRSSWRSTGSREFCIVSSLHDGMNLVAKEFVAARDDLDGVLILSELAGAAQELAEALIINPYDERGFTAAIARAHRHAGVGAAAAHAGAAPARRRPRRARLGVGHPRSARAAERTGVPCWVDAMRDRGARVRRAGRRRRRGRTSASTAGICCCSPTTTARSPSSRRRRRRRTWPTTCARRSTRWPSLDDVTVGVVSGRRLVDVAERVGPAAEFVAGLHGLEITGPECRVPSLRARHASSRSSRGSRATPRASWPGVPGVLLEDKTYALTCHVRLAPPELADRALEEFEALAEPQLEARVLKLLIGAKAARAAARGRLAQGARRASGSARASPRASTRRSSVVYLGDDRTDEDAFTALADDDFAIGVGERPHTHLIDFRLSGPDGGRPVLPDAARRESVPDELAKSELPTCTHTLFSLSCHEDHRRPQSGFR